MSLCTSLIRELLSYEPESGVFIWRVTRDRIAAGSVAGYIDEKGYRRITIFNKGYRAHRLAWMYCYGKDAPEQIDHINGDKADNRLANLRAVTNAQNQQNVRKARSNNKVGLLGVTKVRDKFQANIWFDGKTHILGAFDSPEEAHASYMAAKAIRHEGYIS